MRTVKRHSSAFGTFSPLHGEKGAAARGGVAQACEVGALFRSDRQ